MIVSKIPIDIIWEDCRSGKRCSWRVYMRDCSIGGHYTYSRADSARKAARRTLSRLFPDVTP